MYSKETQEKRDKVLQEIEKLRDKHYWEMAQLDIKLMSLHDNEASKELRKHTQGSKEWKAVQKKYYPQYN